MRMIVNDGTVAHCEAQLLNRRILLVHRAASQAEARHVWYYCANIIWCSLEFQLPRSTAGGGRDSSRRAAARARQRTDNSPTGLKQRSKERAEITAVVCCLHHLDTLLMLAYCAEPGRDATMHTLTRAHPSVRPTVMMLTSRCRHSCPP